MRSNAFLSNEKAQVNAPLVVSAILILIIAAAMMVIGTILLQEFVDSSPMTTYNSTTRAGDRMEPVMTSITGSAQSAMGLSGTMLLVIVGATILTVLASVFLIFQYFR